MFLYTVLSQLTPHTVKPVLSVHQKEPETGALLLQVNDNIVNLVAEIVKSAPQGRIDCIWKKTIDHTSNYPYLSCC